MKKFKNGDVISDGRIICIYRWSYDLDRFIAYCELAENGILYLYLRRPIDLINYRIANKKEIKKIFDALEKCGYRWNHEKETMDNTPWRAKIGDEYYYIDSNLNIYSDEDMYKYRDNSRYYACNYAKTEKELEIKRNKIKKILEGD